jgi:hypothetical protein
MDLAENGTPGRGMSEAIINCSVFKINGGSVSVSNTSMLSVSGEDEV